MADVKPNFVFTLWIFEMLTLLVFAPSVIDVTISAYFSTVALVCDIFPPFGIFLPIPTTSLFSPNIRSITSVISIRASKVISKEFFDGAFISRGQQIIAPLFNYSSSCVSITFLYHLHPPCKEIPSKGSMPITSAYHDKLHCIDQSNRALILNSHKSAD